MPLKLVFTEAVKLIRVVKSGLLCFNILHLIFLCSSLTTLLHTFTISQLGVPFWEECQQCEQTILGELRIYFLS